MANVESDDSSENRGPSRPGLPVEPLRLFRALSRGRWWLLLATAAGVLSGVLLARFAIGNRYEATATIRYLGAPSLEDGSAGDVRRELPSRLESLRRPEVLQRVARQLGIQQNTAQLNAMFDSLPDAESGLITIKVRGTEAEATANFANTLIRTYVEHENEHRLREINQSISSLESRIATAQTQVTEARRQYDEFRQAHHIADLNSEQQSTVTAAVEARSRAELKRAQVAGLEARIRELSSRLGNQPVVAAEPVSAESREALRESRRQLELVRRDFSDEHPRVQALREQVRRLERQVGPEDAPSSVARTVSAARQSLENARTELAQLEQVANEAQQRVAVFSTFEGEGTTLLASVNTENELLEALQNRKSQLQVMAGNPDAGLRILAEATPPESPVPSKRKYYVALGVPLVAIFLTLALLVFFDLKDLRLYSANEVAFWSNAPVVGSTAWPREPQALSDFVADLDDYIPNTDGSMLVVGSSDQMLPLVREVARQLSPWVDMPVGTQTMVDLTRRSLPSGDPGFVHGATEVGGRPEMLAPPTIVNLAPYGLLNPHLGAAPTQGLVVTPWEGGLDGQALRRAARLADRVMVLAPSGNLTIPQLYQLLNRIGRKDGVGFAIVDLDPDFVSLSDRAGPLEFFWNASSNRKNESIRPPVN